MASAASSFAIFLSPDGKQAAAAARSGEGTWSTQRAAACAFLAALLSAWPPQDASAPAYVQQAHAHIQALTTNLACAAVPDATDAATDAPLWQSVMLDTHVVVAYVACVYGAVLAASGAASLPPWRPLHAVRGTASETPSTDTTAAGAARLYSSLQAALNAAASTACVPITGDIATDARALACLPTTLPGAGAAVWVLAGVSARPSAGVLFPPLVWRVVALPAAAVIV